MFYRYFNTLKQKKYRYGFDPKKIVHIFAPAFKQTR